MARWLHAIRQPTTYLGVLVIAIIWGGIVLLSSEEHSRAYENSVRQGGNLSRLLEEYVSRVVQSSDSALLSMRQGYARDPQHFDISSWASVTRSSNTLTMKFGLVGPDGFIKQSSAGPIRSPTYVGDLETFQFHQKTPEDQLFIGQPMIGMLSGKLTIQLSRRLYKPDGSFDGFIVASLDVNQLENFFGSLDIGRTGIVSVVGFDGVIRARSGPDPATRTLTGISIAKTELFHSFRTHPTGHFWNAADSARFDGVSRLISYRVVGGLPLLAMVGLAENDIYQQADATLRKYVLAGTILSLIVLIVMGVGALRQAHIIGATDELQRSKRSLEKSNVLLDAALTNMPHGLCMFDGDQRLVVGNARYCEMYGLSPEQTQPGTPLRAILEARVAVGMPPDVAKEFVRARLGEISRGVAYSAVNYMNDGHIYAVSHQPMADGGWVAIHQDVTERRKMEQALVASTEALKNSNARFAAALENMSQGLCMIDADQRILVTNERYRQIYNLPEDLVKPGTTLTQILECRAASGNFIGPVPAEYIAAQLNNPTDIEKLGNGRVVLVLRHPMADGCWLTTHEDITERWRNETRVAFLAHHDALTSLANRAALVEKIEDACARYRRWGEEFNVLMVDLDRFKQVNDTFGHPAGDELLKQVSERLKATLQETDVLARLGGDEFAIVQVNDANQCDAAQALATQIITLIGEPFTIEGHAISIGASVGIALAPQHGIHADDLLKMADLALYHAKALGRNRYAIFEPALGQAAVAKHLLESELRRALSQNEFEVHYQPIVDTKTLKVCSVEALIRWRHPQKGLIAPDQFIPLAEETGTILQIGEWVLQEACREAVKWPVTVKVAVNLSAVQLRNANLIDYVMCVLVDTGLPPERLELEVTETALIEHGAECLALLKKLKNMGITVALDDFGTGYSSLSQLTMFPFDKIKIDKSFTKSMTNRADCAAIISAVLALAQSLDIQTTAEGVEKAEQLRILRLAGVSTVQGYLIQRPCPASELKFDAPYDFAAVVNAA